MGRLDWENKDNTKTMVVDKLIQMPSASERIYLTHDTLIPHANTAITHFLGKNSLLKTDLGAFDLGGF